MLLPALLLRRTVSPFLRRAFSSSAPAPSSKAGTWRWTKEIVEQSGRRPGSPFPSVGDPDSGILPAAVVKSALRLPVPSAFPDLQDDRLPALLRTTQKPVGGEDPDAFVDAYHPERLEWFGDTLLKLVVMETLLQLAPIQRLKLGGALKAPNLAELTKETSRLVTDDMNAKLTTEFQLTPGSLSVRDQWEAAIAALYFSNGYKALVDFLVPLVKGEFFAHWPALKKMYEVPMAAQAQLKKVKPRISIRGVIASSPSTAASTRAPAPTISKSSSDVPLPQAAGAWDDNLTREEVFKMKKLNLSFPDLATAIRDFLPTLQASGSTFSFRQLGKKLVIRLPGYPIIQATPNTTRPRMSSLVRRCIKVGAIKIINQSESGFKTSELPELPAFCGNGDQSLTSKEIAKLPKHNISFPHLSAAQRDFFSTLAARNVAFSFRSSGREMSFRLAGHPALSLKVKKHGHKLNTLIEHCVKHGMIKIASPATAAAASPASSSAKSKKTPPPPSPPSKLSTKSVQP
ncbi:hypothetical protein JCM8097_002276 [Rhodosporidiobolus ruineniae]